jgi:protein-disulfide isomerase
MFRTTSLLGLGVIVALASSACNKDSKAADQGAGTDKPSVELPKDAEGRLALLEKKVDKIIEVLSKALGSPEPDPEGVYSVPIDPLDPIEGPVDAKVTVVEGFEFACPYCLQANPIVEDLRAAFPKDVRVVTKYLVVHQPAIPSGLAVCAANKQGKFTEMKNTIWQKAWGPDGRIIQTNISPEAMELFAQELGLDMAKYKKDVEGEECRGWLQSSQTTLNAVGQSGTPGFYINGRPLGGLVPLEAMKQIVAQELEKADKVIAGGVPQKDFYKVAVVDKGEKRVKGWFDVD